jgi:hypothetical protein
MKVLPISLPEKMIEEVRKDSSDQGISMAELIRRIIYLHYNNKADNDDKQKEEIFNQ